MAGHHPGRNLLWRAVPQRREHARALPDVDALEERLSLEAGLQREPNQHYLVSLRLHSVPDDRAPRVNQSEIVVGRGIQNPGEILLGVYLELGLMALVGLALGDAFGDYLSSNYSGSNSGFPPLLTPTSSAVGVVCLWVVPGLRAVGRVDLGEISKGQSL